MVPLLRTPAKEYYARLGRALTWSSSSSPRVAAGQGETPVALNEIVPLVNALLGQNQSDEAIVLLSEVLGPAELVLGNDHPMLARLRARMVVRSTTKATSRARRRPCERRWLCSSEPTARTRRKSAAFSTPSRWWSNSGIGPTAIRVYEGLPEPRPSSVVDVYTSLAMAEAGLGHIEVARSTMEFADATIAKGGDLADQMLGRHHFEHAKLLWECGEHDKARTVAEQAIERYAAAAVYYKSYGDEVRAWLAARAD